MSNWFPKCQFQLWTNSCLWLLGPATGPLSIYATPLAQGTINGFDNTGLPFAFGTRSVLVAGQYLRIGFLEIDKTPAVAAVTAR
jgi:hypothetical protein